MKVDINCDLGEGFGKYELGLIDDILPHISSVNIACGFHAGDPLIMADTVKKAIEAGVKIGAHPGLPDLLGFGRREMKISKDEVVYYTLYQVGALKAIVESFGGKLNHIKLHGALYNMVSRDEQMSVALVKALSKFDDVLELYALSGSELYKAAVSMKYPVKSEVFADRNYMANGQLVPRSQEGAVIHDRAFAIDRMVKIVETKTCTSLDGKDFDVLPDTICVHGDHMDAVLFAKDLNEALSNAGIEVK